MLLGLGLLAAAGCAEPDPAAAGDRRPDRATPPTGGRGSSALPRSAATGPARLPPSGWRSSRCSAVGAGIRGAGPAPAVTAPDLGALPAPARPTRPRRPTRQPPPTRRRRPTSPQRAARGHGRPAVGRRRPTAGADAAPAAPGAPATLACPARGDRTGRRDRRPDATASWRCPTRPRRSAGGSAARRPAPPAAAPCSPVTSTRRPQGVGALPRCGTCRLGSPVVLTDTFGGPHAYAVTARRTYPKYALPRPRVHRRPAGADHLRRPVRRAHRPLPGQHRRLRRAGS